ncbi:hypothetical protein BDV32DRAFT_116954 [Aspergillus pseudonomiae]|nr:hypothetical protein BDV32DRAFT_116954 [Aspergillus pseudonomiae]
MVLFQMNFMKICRRGVVKSHRGVFLSLYIYLYICLSRLEYSQGSLVFSLPLNIY